MLLNSFFTIQSSQITGTAIEALIGINAGHPVFEGHFPGQPVVPGVCMIEMMKEVMQQALGKTLRIESAPVIKFLTMLTPAQHVSAAFKIEFIPLADHKLKVNATLSSAQDIFLKFNGILSAQ